MSKQKERKFKNIIKKSYRNASNAIKMLLRMVE